MKTSATQAQPDFRLYALSLLLLAIAVATLPGSTLAPLQRLWWSAGIGLFVLIVSLWYLHLGHQQDQRRVTQMAILLLLYGTGVAFLIIKPQHLPSIWLSLASIVPVPLSAISAYLLHRKSRK